MDNSVIPSLKLIYKPLIMYYGEWELYDGLANLAIIKNDKNLFNEFLERYYYMPLKVVFKDDELARSFKYGICSKLGSGGRSLYFSKKAFLRNVISNADEVIASGGDDVFKNIKKAIRTKKDMYRDVLNIGEESPYYEDIKNEFLLSNVDTTLEEYLILCKKKYTKLLTGYNAVLDLFDKSINVDKFISCFDPDKLYLFTAYSLLKHSKEHYDLYGELDYNIVVFDTYRDLVNKLRKKDNFYNTHIIIDDDVVYTIDDLFKEYDELLNTVNGK